MWYFIAKRTHRDVVAVIIFSIFTCGIYALYWLYQTSKETSIALNGNNEAGTELLWVIITCGLYSIYWYYKTSKRLLELQMRANVAQKDLILVTLRLSVFGLGIVSDAIIQANLNTIWEQQQN